MRLPIYRHLNERLEILGLSVAELAVVCCVFVGLSWVLSPIRYSAVLTLGVSLGLALLLRFLHRRFEQNYLEKLFRFVALPDDLERRVVKVGRKENL